MTDFTLYPAIDLRAGKVVRLSQGDPNQQTIYADDPTQTVRRWLEAGAAWLHVVNLDGALEQPDEANRAALKAILRAVRGSVSPDEADQPRVQYGGGVRSLEDIRHLLEAGVSRVVVGTVVVKSPTILTTALEQYGPERVAVALDVRDGWVQVRGWQEASAFEVASLAQELSKTGLRTLIYTNIQRDGTGQGVDFSTAHHLAALTGLEVIASGGVNSLEDLRRARSAGLSGVIIGRALYDGRIDLKEALLWAIQT